MSALGARLEQSLVHRPVTWVAASLALAAAGLVLATRLELRTDFPALLPPEQPSVIELRHVLAATPGVSNVFVVLEGRDVAALRATGDALVPRLRAVGHPWVESAADGVQEARAFLLPRAGLFMTEAHLDDLLDAIVAHERWAFRDAIGANLDDDDTRPPEPLDDAFVRRAIGGGDFEQLQRFPDGYYQGPAGPGEQALVVIARAAVPAGDLDGSREALRRVRAVVDATLRDTGAAARGVRAGYAGDLVTGLAEYSLISEDVLDVGLFGVALVLGVLLLFFRRPSALLALGITIGAGCALTFGVAELAIGHLNLLTAFLLSIIAGNGINFGILWLSRYLEARRAGAGPRAALSAAMSGTWAATLTAACAAGAAYAALGVSGFRGFRDFAVIGAAGMLLYWLASYTLLPALAVLAERALARREATRPGVPSRRAFSFDEPFRRVVAAAPRATALAGALLTVAASVAAVRHLLGDPMEYDMRKLQSDPRATTELYRVSAIAARIVGANAEGAMVVVTDDPRDTPAAAAALRRVRDAAPAHDKPFQAVHTLQDFVPPDQDRRLPRILEIARRLRRDAARGAFSDDEWRRLAPMLPPGGLRPFTDADLPADLQRLFTTRDGVRGRLLYVEPTAGRSDSDLRYLIRWADAFRETRLPDGRVVRGSGRAVIFADLLRASMVDMPRAVLLSLGVTALAVVLLFRRARPSAAVLATLAVGIVWLGGGLAVAGVRLNFINFIALPITFGIGVDYAVNLLGRYRAAPEAGVLAAMQGVGGPVILCSLTTSLGYLALLRSHNQAVRSLGAVAVLGEASCLLAAMLVLPAALRWRELLASRNGRNA